jgi:hypothetical protein
MVEDTWHPIGIDTATPNAARMYDYFLGGKDHFPADREAADKILRYAPEVPHVVRENRAFLARAVRHLCEAGVRQFLDIGTGLPTQNAVHEVAQRHRPDARVVYVDNDPVVLTHARALLTGVGEVGVVHGDLREPEAIMNDPAVRAALDFDEPIAVLLLAILHFIPDSDDPAGLVARLCAALPRGSHVVVTHATPQDSKAEDIPKVIGVYNSSTSPVTLRDREQIRTFFGGFELIDPGLVYVSRWRPHAARTLTGPDRSRAYGGVARR